MRLLHAEAFRCFLIQIPLGHESKGLFVTFVAGFAVAAVTAFSSITM